MINIIICNYNIDYYIQIKNYILSLKESYNIYLVDSGTRFILTYPEYKDKIFGIYGDCDSFSYKNIINLGFKNIFHMKNNNKITDLEFALLKIKGKDKIIVFASGDRIDHQIVILNLIYKYDFTLFTNSCKIITFKHNIKIYKNSYKYISFFSLYNDSIISSNGLLYEMNDYKIDKLNTFTISNEILGKYTNINSKDKIFIIQSN